MTIRIELEDEDLRSAFSRLAALSHDMRDAMTAIANVLLHHTEENFAAEGTPHWAPLAPATIRERQRRGYWPGKILQRRGELAAAVTPFADALNAGLSVAKPYARIHQLGGSAGRGGAAKIPARPYLPVTADLELQEGVAPDILDVLRDAIARAAK